MGMTSTAAAAKPSSKPNPPTRPAPAKPSREVPWTVRVPQAYIDQVLSDLPRHLKDMMLVLETFCRSHCFTFASSKKIAERYGCKIRWLQVMLKLLAELGWVRLEELSPGKRSGTIVILLKRVDPDLPVFDPADDSPTSVTIDDIRAAIGRIRTGQKPLFQNTNVHSMDGCPFSQSQPLVDLVFQAHSSAPDVRIPVRQEGAHSSAPEEYIVVSYEEDAFEDEFAREGEENIPPERNDRTGPQATALPGPRPMLALPAPVRTASQIAEPHAQPVEPVDVQVMLRRFAASHAAEKAPPRPADLPPAPRLASTCPAVSGPRRRPRVPDTPIDVWERLAEHDPVIARELATRKAARDSPPPPVIPASTRELLEKLPGSPPDWHSHAAQALCQEFGSEQDRKLWSQFDGIAWSIASGKINVRHAVSAYDQAMKPGIQKRGAKFWAALQGLTGLNSEELRSLYGSGLVGRQ